jgi:hypothetical protein
VVAASPKRRRAKGSATVAAQIKYEEPWRVEPGAGRYWYHTMKFPDGEIIKGHTTIKDFNEYIGGYELKGKKVLDVGTASGYLAFNAEQAGAIVTGLDAASMEEFRFFPFPGSQHFDDVQEFRRAWTEHNLIPIKTAWWHSWHKFNSKAKCTYTPLSELYEWPEKMFDVVMAGAIVEHLSDPVYAIGAWARLAREAVLIPFTDVIPEDDLFIRPILPLDNPSAPHVWWHLSRGLYRKLFDNLGFDVQFTSAEVLPEWDGPGAVPSRRPSIVAIRRGTEASRTFRVANPLPEAVATAEPVLGAAPVQGAIARKKGFFRKLRDL